MRTAFLSAIHGNLPALQAVDADVRAHHPDQVFCLGDVIGYGAQPGACIALVRERGWPTVLGNHEATVLEPAQLDQYNAYARAAGYFTLGALTAEDRRWISTLPVAIDTPDFQLVHASPERSLEFPYLQNQADVAAAFAAASRPLVFIGHSCVPVVLFEGPDLVFSREPEVPLEPGQRAIINVGSVGQPRDHDPRSCWVLFDSERRQVSYHRVAYDQQEAQRRIVDAGLPPLLGQRLLTGT